MADSRELLVRLIGDSRSLDRAYKNSAVAGKAYGRTVALTGAQIQASAEKNIAVFSLEQKELAGLASAYGRMAKAAVAGSDQAVAAAKLQRDTLAKLQVTGGGGLFGKLGAGGLARGVAGGAGFVAAIEGAHLLGAALRQGVKDAASLQKSGEAIDNIFGASAGKVKAFAEAAKGIGISAVESEALATRLGILTRNLGIGADKSAEMTIRLQQLAGSIAEIRGIDPSTVLENLPQALAGNLRSLKQLGFAFSQAQLKTEAVRLGLIGLKDALTPAAKAQAIVSLATKHLSQLQAEAAKNSGDLTNQTEQLKASFSNALAVLGKKVAIPVLTGLVEETNLAITGLGKLRDAAVGAFSFKIPGESWLGRLGGAPEEIQKVIDAAKQLKVVADSLAAEKAFTIESAQVTGGKAFQAPLDLGQVALARRAARGPTNAQTSRRNTVFDASIGRAQDRAQDIPTLQGQIAEEQRIAGLIEARIKATKDITRKLNLEDALAGELRQIAADKKQLAQNFTDALQLKIENRDQLARDFADSLQLGLEKAGATAGLGDDLAALKKINANIRAEIKATGETVDLKRQLFESQQAIIATQKQQRDAKQFRSLGLDATGQPLVPLKAGLSRELNQVTAKIAGTAADTPKNERTLKSIRKLLGDPFVKISREVRSTIKQMLDDIDQQLKDHSSKGPLTKTHALDTSKILAGLGLDPAAARELRGRLSKFNTAGRALGGTTDATGLGRGGFITPSGFIVESHTTINLDGQKVASVVTRNQQKTKRRNPRQKRGPNRGD